MPVPGLPLPRTQNSHRQTPRLPSQCISSFIRGLIPVRPLRTSVSALISSLSLSHGIFSTCSAASRLRCLLPSRGGAQQVRHWIDRLSPLKSKPCIILHKMHNANRTILDASHCATITLAARMTFLENRCICITHVPPAEPSLTAARRHTCSATVPDSHNPPPTQGLLTQSQPRAERQPCPYNASRARMMKSSIDRICRFKASNDR